MALTFKSLGKKLGRAARKAVKPALRIAAAQVTGGLSEAAIRVSEKARQVAKGLGAFKPKPLPDIPPTSVAGIIDRTRRAVPGKLKGISDVKATAMPGGHKIKSRGFSGRSRGFTDAAGERLIKRIRKLSASPRKPKRSASKGTARRAPPKGGKDFKALSRSWRAAGKPGTWQAWVSSH